MLHPQSILTVTFEIAGDLSEDALNAFIQVNTLFIIHISAVIANYMQNGNVLWIYFPPLQDLLWEKIFCNKDGQPMSVIRLKVQHNTIDTPVATVINNVSLINYCNQFQMCG